MSQQRPEPGAERSTVPPDGRATDGRDEVATWALRGIGLALGVVIVAIGVDLVQRSTDVLIVVVIAILLAGALDPVVDRLRDRLPVSRVQAILLLYVVLVLAAGALLLIIVPTAVDQLAMLGEEAPRMIDQVEDWAAELDPEILGTVVDRALGTARAFARGGEAAATDPEVVVAAGRTAAETAITIITTLTLVFFWLISRAALQRFMLALLPAEQRGSVRETWDRIEHRMGDWLRGQLTLMTTIGVATTIAYLLLGLESAIVLGVIAGLAEIIPIIGPAIGAIPAILVALVNGGPELALAVVAVYIVIQIVEGQILVPAVMRRSVGLPPFVVIVALLVGAAAGGLVGALLAVPAVAAAVIVLESIQDRVDPVSLESPGAVDTTATERSMTGG